mmetsp:Transcript_122776/g.306641  ORF Transcript_122776/g.306641 Transcript_122776/m.306641 type:complete len:255 (-) Transcript_122776:967-1731(-)
MQHLVHVDDLQIVALRQPRRHGLLPCKRPARDDQLQRHRRHRRRIRKRRLLVLAVQQRGHDGAESVVDGPGPDDVDLGAELLRKGDVRGQLEGLRRLGRGVEGCGRFAAAAEVDVLARPLPHAAHVVFERGLVQRLFRAFGRLELWRKGGQGVHRLLAGEDGLRGLDGDVVHEEGGPPAPEGGVDLWGVRELLLLHRRERHAGDQLQNPLALLAEAGAAIRLAAALDGAVPLTLALLLLPHRLQHLLSEVLVSA